MPKYSSPKNIHMDSPVKVHPVYDDTLRAYVVDLSPADAKKFEPVNADQGYGFERVADEAPVADSDDTED